MSSDSTVDVVGMPSVLLLDLDGVVWLAHEPIDRVVTSPKARAAETVAPLVGRLGLSPHVVDDLEGVVSDGIHHGGTHGGGKLLGIE